MKSSAKKIDYPALSKTSSATNGEYSFYAVILDATSPYKKQVTSLCSLRIIDPSVHYPEEGAVDKEHNAAVSQYCTVTLFSKEMRNLPRVNRVGDIIRVLNTTCTMFKGAKQFNLNLQQKGEY